MPTTKKVAKKTTKKATPKKVAKKVTKKSAPKKTTKKSVAKNSATKKATKSKAAKKDMVYADDAQSFWATNGEVLNSLIALKDALERMDKDAFSYHVSKEHNDFANWVESVLCDGDCADDLRKSHTPNSAKTVIVRHLKLYAV